MLSVIQISDNKYFFVPFINNIKAVIHVTLQRKRLEIIHCFVFIRGHAVAQLVEALRYLPKRSRVPFPIGLLELRPQYGLGVDYGSNKKLSIRSISRK